MKERYLTMNELIKNYMANYMDRDYVLLSVSNRADGNINFEMTTLDNESNYIIYDYVISKDFTLQRGVEIVCTILCNLIENNIRQFNLR